MSLEKVVFGFFVLLAATLNFGFFIGDISDPVVHSVYELFAALVVSLIATGAGRRPPGAGWCAATGGSAASSPTICGPTASRSPSSTRPGTRTNRT